MIQVFRNVSACLDDSTRGDLTMADVSRQGDEQFAGERDDRDAAGPAALGANALAEPTAESTGRLVSHPHPGKLDHCGAQTRITCLRDTLFLVNATTLPWTRSQAGIGRQLPSVLKLAEQTLKGVPPESSVGLSEQLDVRGQRQDGPAALAQDDRGDIVWVPLLSLGNFRGLRQSCRRDRRKLDGVLLARPAIPRLRRLAG
jgi:hypothetical protein